MSVGFLKDELQQAGAAFFLLFEQFLDLLRCEQAVLDEGVGNAFAE
jgi:hypothetical protein